jgi:DNA-binding protein WhiA
LSFSAMTKAEMARVMPRKRCCQIAELTAIIGMDGTVKGGAHGEPALIMSSQSAPVARKIYKLCKLLLQPLAIQVAVTKKPNLKKRNVYHVLIPYQSGAREAFAPLGLSFAGEGWQVNWRPIALEKRCCQKAYLRGAFLGGGSVNDPEGTYHLEMITRDPVHSQTICEVMSFFDLSPRISERKQYHVVYLKESDQIVQFLNVAGAHRALLEFESTRVVKDMRNRVNRLVNCETANLSKTVDTGVRQVEMIRLLEEKMGLEKLPLPLREIARLRLEFPDASLRELGQMLDPPIGKSGANHRLRKLEEMAKELEVGQGRK